MAKLLRLLSENILNRSVIDNTGLTGNYDFTLEWKIGDESQGPMFQETGDHPQVTSSAFLPEFSRPSFFNAIQEQLGLKLESQKQSWRSTRHRSCREAFGKLAAGET